jgi:hypothetical protein
MLFIEKWLVRSLGNENVSHVTAKPTCCLHWDMALRGDLDGPTSPQGHNLEGCTLTTDNRLVHVAVS